MESMIMAKQPVSMLLVEDENTNRELLYTILTKKYPDLLFQAAINGRTGLELFKTHQPDIVITDVNMPEMGGVQMAERILAIKPNTKFIVLTGDCGKNISQDSAAKGVEIDHCITKPVSFAELFAAIEQCLGEIAQQN